MIESLQPTSELIARAEAVRSPVTFLTAEEFNSYKGKLIALLTDGPDKGTVIAHAPINIENPSEHRKAIQEQVRTSQYKDRRYQVREILPDTFEG